MSCGIGSGSISTRTLRVFSTKEIAMDELTFARIKKEFDAVRQLDLNVAENQAKVNDFYERVMPQLFAAMDHYEREIDRLKIRLGFADMIP